MIAPSRCAEILQVACDGHDRHHLRGCRDVEPALPHVAVRAAAEPDRDVAERPVVDVDATPPADRERIDRERVAVQQVRLEDRRQQVVRGADGVDVAGEVEIQVLHRHDLRVAAAGGAALDPEHGPDRCLAQAEHRSSARVAEPLRQRDRRRRLALAGLRRRHRRHADQLPVCGRGESVEHRKVDLGLRAAVRLDLVGGEPRRGGELVDRLQDGGLRDLEAGRHRALHERNSIAVCRAGG